MKRLPIEDHNRIIALAGEIGNILTQTFPEAKIRGINGTTVPKKYYKEIAENITMVVANILQAYLNAGSEREVTEEELGPVIEEHVKGWADAE